jgi:hypothetical protein
MAKGKSVVSSVVFWVIIIFVVIPIVLAVLFMNKATDVVSAPPPRGTSSAPSTPTPIEPSQMTVPQLNQKYCAAMLQIQTLKNQGVAENDPRMAAAVNTAMPYAEALQQKGANMPTCPGVDYNS